MKKIISIGTIEKIGEKDIKIEEIGEKDIKIEEIGEKDIKIKRNYSAT